MTAERAPAPTDAGYDRGAHSPCIGICVLDEASGLCTGCARTGVEVAEWMTASAGDRAAIWDALPARASDMRLTRRLLPWSPEGIHAWARDQLRDASGTWMIGRGEAAGAFASDLTQPIDVADYGNALVARQDGAALRLALHEKTRAFAFGPAASPDLIVLALPKGRVSFAAAETLQALGPDEGAVGPDERRHDAFDLGYGVDGARVLLRTSDPGVRGSLKVAAREGLSPMARAMTLGMTMAGTAAVHETEGARIERSRALRADETAAAAAINARLAHVELPGWAAVVATFQPAPGR
ncbi:MAG: DUF1289 domain-containing protein [Pseudomonadota bacterium]